MVALEFNILTPGTFPEIDRHGVVVEYGGGRIQHVCERKGRLAPFITHILTLLAKYCIFCVLGCCNVKPVWGS